MTNGQVIGVVVGGALLATAIGFVIYRKVRSKTDDDLTFEVASATWAPSSVEYKINRNGKEWTSGTLFYRQDLVGKGPTQGQSDGKNNISETHLANGKVMVTGTSISGTPKFKTIVDFNRKITQKG